MRREAIGIEDFSRSVIAVPPLARHDDLRINVAANRTMIRHLEAGGVTSLLYAGNAVLYHIPLSEYRGTLEMLSEAVGERTWLIPAAGPDYGRLVDQADVLRELGFPTALVLPCFGPSTPAGAERGIRRFAERLGRPVLLYLRSEDYLTPEGVERLVREGAVLGIKYAIVRADPAVDPFLAELTQRIERERIVSGIGERPALAHWEVFKLRSFTSGSVSIAPGLSSALLAALVAGDLEEAARLQSHFMPLEDLRDALGPARVLHDAVSFAQIADMGPMLPFMANLTPEEARSVAPAATALLSLERRYASEELDREDRR